MTRDTFGDPTTNERTLSHGKSNVEGQVLLGTGVLLYANKLMPFRVHEFCIIVAFCTLRLPEDP